MSIDESNFIDELLKRNPEALDYVIQKYAPLVKGIAAKVLSPLGNSNLIEECISDVFISAWQNTVKFNREKTSFKNWFACVAKYRAIDYYRKNLNTSKVETIENYIVESPYNLEEEVINLQNEKALKKLINNLDQPNKKIFIMKFYLGMSSEEIGQALNLSRTAVDNRIFRERKKLKINFRKIQEEGV